MNQLGIETYLASVVGSEMPISGPQQRCGSAVAARTMPSSSVVAGRAGMSATVVSQVYRGVESETDSTRSGAQHPPGVGAPGRLIDAVFHSSSGGDRGERQVCQQLPYLVSVPITISTVQCIAGRSDSMPSAFANACRRPVAWIPLTC